MFKLINDKHSILTINPLPSLDKVKEHYKNIYFQELTSNGYHKFYTEKELKHYKNKSEYYLKLFEKFTGTNPSNIFEPGYGEGFTLSYFKNKNIEIYGVDLSQEGLYSHNKELLENQNIIQGYFEEKIYFDKKFDLIILDHFLEHVYDIDKTMDNLKKYVNEKTILIITVPNEFNAIQKSYLLNKDLEKEQAPWIQNIEHLRYFQPSSLDKLLTNYDFKRISNIMSDFPIDINILSEESNYYNDPKLGKNPYMLKLIFEDLLFNNSFEDYLELCSAFAKNNVGRNLTAVFKLN